MSSVEYRPVSAVDFTSFTRTFNRAYSDYYTPISMTTDAFRSLIARDDLMFDASVAAVDHHNIIGTGLLGIRGDTAWVGGMGVIPGRRRQGIGRQMMRYLIEQARTRQIKTVYLEVIEANTGAYTLYQEIGFSAIRYLHILKRPAQPALVSNNTFHVMEDDASAVLTHYAEFHDTRNCWQRSRPSLMGLSYQAQAVSVLGSDGLAGYAIGWFSPHEIRIADLAVTPGVNDQQRLQIAHAMLAQVHNPNPRAMGSAYNVADNDPLLPAYQAAGYGTDFRQIEMELALGSTE